MSNDKVLVGEGRMGDFVHANQDMAKDKGFKNVSSLWLDKTIPLSQATELFIDAQRRREEIQCPIKNMKPAINDAGNIVFKYVDGREFTPTEHAFRHLSLNLGRIPITYTEWARKDIKVPGMEYKRDKMDMEVLLLVLKNGLRRVDENKEFKFRTYTDGTLRAMFTDQYAEVNNIWYMETLQELFKEMGGTEPRLSHYDRTTDDTLYGNLLIPDSFRQDSDSDYGGMISMSNCEIGKRVLSQYPSLFRAICRNGCVWDQTKGNVLRQVHRGEIDYPDLRERIALNIHHQIPLIDSAITRFLSTKDMQVKGVSMDKVFAQLGAEYKFAPNEIREVVSEYVAHESANSNLFGIINAITRAGQNTKIFDSEAWVNADFIGGDLMNYSKNNWDKFISKAKVMDKKEMDKVFGIAV